MIKLLIVDDDIALRRMLALALKADDVALTLAGDGNEALALAEQVEPDVVLLDIRLAGMSGLDVCHALRSHARPTLASVGIILMSGNVGKSSVQGPNPATPDHWVGKPFKLGTMRSLVRDLSHQVVLRRQL